MCCLFGIIDYGRNFTGRQLAHILSVLSAECEARGTDATGIAYNSSGHLHIYKRPLPAHKLRFGIPMDTRVVMGHTRMTTQGSEKKNFNNHPFKGFAGEQSFALAHNGVLHNDLALRKTLKLPKTNIQTDSYIAVQLIEQKKALNLDSLKYMAEEVEGSFTFTVLDGRDNLYIIKGDNPMCLCHFPRTGLYLYASTDEILGRALKKLYIPLEKPVRVEASCGDILKIDRAGAVTLGQFDCSRLYQGWYCSMYWPHGAAARKRASVEDEYLDELKSVAGSFGYTPGMIDRLLRQGFTTDEIEEFLYCGEL